MASITLTSGEVGLVAAAVVVLAALISWWSASSVARRQRQLTVYGHATKIIGQWVEMLYRIRRRSENSFEDIDKRFHKLQEEVSYYSAWIGSDSPHMRRRYANLFEMVKDEMKPLIAEAWREPVRAIPRDPEPGDKNPHPHRFEIAFTNAVHNHVSANPLRRLWCAWHSTILDHYEPPASP